MSNVNQCKVCGMPPDLAFYRGTQAYQDAIRDTQAFEKFLNYIDTLLNKPEFISELKWFRSHIADIETSEELPKDGLPLPKTHIEHSQMTVNYDYKYDEEAQDYYNIEEYTEREQAFRDKYDLDIFGDAFEFLLYYNSVKPMKGMGYCSFLEIVDLQRTIASGLEDDEIFGKGSYKKSVELIQHVSKTTPIAVLIHPYMSKRDIIDAVRKVYDVAIEPIQNRYKKQSVGLQGSRKKSEKLKERDQFIYEHRHLPAQEIMKLVSDEFGKVYDYTYIQSILSREKEKKK